MFRKNQVYNKTNDSKVYIPILFEDMLQYLSNSIKRKAILGGISDPKKISPNNPSERVEKDMSMFIKLFQGEESNYFD